MGRTVETVIDLTRCTGCGSCVQVCPSRTLALVDGKARVVGADSLQCDQCAAVCPEGAIRVGTVDPAVTALHTLAEGDPARVAPSDLVALMGRRRSCRRYKRKPPAREVLEDLVRIGIRAPTGTNSQAWRFTILPDRAAVLRLGQAVADCFRLINRLAGHPLAGLVSRAIPGNPVGFYRREYLDTVAEALAEWDRGEGERLFHGAPSVILIGSAPGGSCPREDALLAAGHMVLAAEAMGLGTCLVGFAVEAIKIDPRVRKRIGLPKGERVHAALAVGHPAVRYARPAGRLALPIRYLEG